MTGDFWPQPGWPYFPTPPIPPVFNMPVLNPIVYTPIFVFPPPRTLDSVELDLIDAARKLLEARGYVVIAPAGETP